jgi:K+/H+ antiporter YhaU regulatory subunit KhtT
VVARDGKRHLYVFTSRDDEPTAVVELSEDQARKVGAVLSGTFFVD